MVTAVGCGDGDGVAATCRSDGGDSASGGFGVDNDSDSKDGVGDDTSKMWQMRYSLLVVGGSGSGKERSEFFIVTRTDGGWGEIQSQEEMSAFFSRTGQMFSCPAAIRRKFYRAHFLLAGQNLSSRQISTFDSLPPDKKLFCGNSVLQIFFAGQQNRVSVCRSEICSQDRFWRSIILPLNPFPPRYTFGVPLQYFTSDLRTIVCIIPQC